MKGIYHKDVGTELTYSEYHASDAHSLEKGTSFPSSPSEGDLYYRTDQHKWYIFNGTSWEKLNLVSHSELSGLDQDDHPQYLLADGSRSVSGHLKPSASNSYDLGSSSYRWRNLYLANVALIRGGIDTDTDTEWRVDMKGSGTAGDIRFYSWYLGSNVFRIRKIGGINIESGGLLVGGTEVITSGRVLQNVSADASIITSGVFDLARIPAIDWTRMPFDTWSELLSKIGNSVGDYLDLSYLQIGGSTVITSGRVLQNIVSATIYSTAVGQPYLKVEGYDSTLLMKKTDDARDVTFMQQDSAGNILIDIRNGKIRPVYFSALLPYLDSTYDLGSPSYEWRDGYFAGKINDLKLALKTGGVLAFWYDLRGESRNLAKGRLVEVSEHSTVDFTNYNPQGIADYYGCRIVGFVSPRYSESYTFYVTSDDGVRVWFNGRLVVDAWKNQGPTTYSWTTDTLMANYWYPIVIEHYEHGGSERLLLEWESASQVRETVPAERLAFSSLDYIASPKVLWGDTGIVAGKILFGDYSSGATFDVNLYRSAADVLKTDDNFDALALRIGGTEIITSGRILQNLLQIGIGTDSPSSKLEIANVTDWWGIGLGTDGNKHFLIGRGSSLDERRMTLHIPNIDQYGGTGTIPTLDIVSSGNVKLLSVESASGNVYIKGYVNPASLRIGGTEVITSSRVLQNIASVAQSLLPDADNSRDFGSLSYRWKDMYVGNRVYVGATDVSLRRITHGSRSDTLEIDSGWDTLLIKGRVIDWTGSNLHIGYERATSDNIIIGRVYAVRPLNDNAIDFGLSSHRWRNGYFVNIHTGDLVLKNGFKISETEDSVVIYSPFGQKIFEIDLDGNVLVFGEIKYVSKRM